MMRTIHTLLLLGVCLGSKAAALSVADFGAIPNDDQCDAAAIRRAIETAAERGDSEVRFEAGTYRLVEAAGVRDRAYISIVELRNIALVGAVDASGRPTTRLERVLELDNDTDPYHQIYINKSHGITVRNFVLANNPPLGSTARVVSVDREADEIVVEVLPGLPAYDGMRCASAHVSDLQTGKLKRFGSTPEEATLTIGLDIKRFWQAVPGTDGRRLKMKGGGFAGKVRAGDGISWHHKAAEARNQTMAMYSEDLVFENIVMPNVSNMGMLAGFNRNLTFRKVRFEPENGNLAVGGRDGLHLSMNTGRLLVEDCYFKGLRMDPLVIRKSFGLVVGSEGHAVTIQPGYPVPAEGKLRFWAGSAPVDAVVESFYRVPGGRGAYRYQLAQPPPDGTVEGTAITYQSYSLDEGVIRNCVFEDNFGSPIINFEENMTIEGCTFDNNSYQVKFGPNRQSGGFVRNNAFRNNTFKNSCWIDITRRGRPSSLLIHSQSKYFKNPMFNADILIRGNTFRNTAGEGDAVAVEVRNAVSVRFEDNIFEGYAEPVLVDPKSTRDITLQQAE